MLLTWIRATGLAALILGIDSSVDPGGQPRGAIPTSYAETATPSAGALDPTFGQGGAAFLSIPGYEMAGRDVALQADGKLVVVGVINHALGNAFVAARFTSHGQLDPTFPPPAVATKIFDGEPWAIAIQPDQKIVVAGHEAWEAAAIARLLPDGRLDSTFGKGGRVTIEMGTSNENIRALALLPDGKILAAGWAFRPSTEDRYKHDMLVIKLRQDGSLDLAFGNGGWVYVDFGRTSGATDLKVQEDGRIVLVGDTGGQFALARLWPDGSLDGGFGHGGLVRTRISSDSHPSAYARAITMTPDGGIVAVGGSQIGSSDDEPVVAKFTQAGVLDPRFGVGGIVQIARPTFYYPGPHILTQHDGKLLVLAADTSSGLAYSGAVRLTASGQLDQEFGEDGRARFGTRPSQPYRMLIHPDGRVTVTGKYSTSMMVFRFLTNLEADLETSLSAAASVNRGRDFDASLLVRNNSSSPARPVWSALRVSGAEVKGFRPSGGTCSSGADLGVIGCDFGTVESGARAQVVISMNAKSVPKVTLSAFSVGSLPDPNLQNNLAEMNIPVRGPRGEQTP